MNYKGNFAMDWLPFSQSLHGSELTRLPVIFLQVILINFIFCLAVYSTMDIIIMIILGIVGGVMIATVAASGIYYSYRTKKDREKEKTAAKVATTTPARRTARTESEPYVVYQDESLVDFDSIPVQPETKRPIRYRYLLSLFFNTTVYIQWACNTLKA